MLARLGAPEDLDAQGFLYEPKMDGTRAICYVNTGLRFVNRRDHEIGERYPEFSFRDRIRAASCVLDGEIVVYDGHGNPSFSLLQKREQSRTSMAGLLSSQHPATYVVFDMLEFEGRDITPLPLEERKDMLGAILGKHERLQLIVTTVHGRRLWSIVEERKLEGVMAKRTDSPYEPGKRSSSWLKIKALKTVDCIIVGFTSERRTISALALGVYFGNELRYVGRVGTGFTLGFLEKLRPVLDGMVIEEPMAKGLPDHPITWVRPELVAEIEYLQLTRDRHLRAPSFVRMRTDKDPLECTSETLEL